MTEGPPFFGCLLLATGSVPWMLWHARGDWWPFIAAVYLVPYLLLVGIPSIYVVVEFARTGRVPPRAAAWSLVVGGLGGLAAGGYVGLASVGAAIGGIYLLLAPRLQAERARQR